MNPKYGHFPKLCEAHGLPEPCAEYRFHPTRKWRIDFAFPEHKIGVEIDGGLWTRGRHSRPMGQIKDFEKGNNAILLGWRVLHVTPAQTRAPQVYEMLRQLIHK